MKIETGTARLIRQTDHAVTRFGIDPFAWWLLLGEGGYRRERQCDKTDKRLHTRLLCLVGAGLVPARAWADLRRAGTSPAPTYRLEEHPDAELNVAWQGVRGVSRQRSKVGIVRLPYAIELEVAEVSDIKRQRVARREALGQRHVEKVQGQSASLRSARSCQTRRINIGSDLRQDGGAGRGRRLRLIVEGGPRVIFRCRYRLIHSVDCFSRNLSREGPQSKRSVARVVIAEVRMIERIDEVDAEINPALPFTTGKRERKILGQREIKELLSR